MAFCPKSSQTHPRNRNNNCIGCSYRTIEYRQFSQEKNSNCYQTTRVGIKCSSCNRVLCVSCVADLQKGLKSKRKSLHSECDEFVRHIDAFHSSRGKVTPEGFIGHCCLISKYSTSPSENKLPPEQQPTTCHNMTRDNSKSEGTIIGGCMCLPEFKLLIATDTTCMDVIGLGSENDPRAKLQGRWHYVIDEEFAAAVASRNVYPKESDVPPDEWTFRDIKMKVPLPHSLTGKDIKKMTVRVYYIPKVQKVTAKLKGSNEISDSEVRSSFYFNSKLRPKHVDVSLLIGYDDTKEDTASILLCRFHKMNPWSFKLKNQNSKSLLQELKKELKNDGLERRRVGGSSGKIGFTKEMKLLMKTHNSSPRCSKGVVWLKDKSELKWHLFYVGTKDGELKYTYYTTPRPGGSFLMPPDKFETYHFLQDFASTKALAAIIVTNLESTPGIPFPNLRICPIAVEEELANATASRAFLKAFIQEDAAPKEQKPPDKRIIKLMFYQFYALHFLNFTLIMHAVGGHLDSFSEGKPSLENRICFTFPLNDYKKTELSNTGYRYGRGGGGMDVFCYALLDWSGYNRRRRRCWTDPNNAGLDGSAIMVARETGQLRNDCTRERWIRFARNDNRIDLPNGVQNIAELAYPPP